MRANKVARNTFKMEDTEYMPHLSLMYGNVSTDKKKKIISEINREFNLSFEVKSIHLVSTDGEPEEWYRIKEFPFKI